MYQLTIEPNTVINLDNGSYCDISNADYQDWLAAGNTPAPVPLSDLKQAKFDEINQAYEAAKATGVPSRALGSVYTYSISIEDLADFNAMVTASMLSQLQGQTTLPILVMNADGVWAYVQHNLAQVQQAGADIYVEMAALITMKQAYFNQILSATDADTVTAISWSTQ